MANVLIHGKTPENITQALKCDENGNLITSPLGGVISNYSLETGGNLEDINNNIKSINAITDKEDGISSVLLENGAAVYADSTPSPIIDINKREGWYYSNVSAGNNFNYYFLDGTQETFILQDLFYMYAKISIDNFSNDVKNLPFLTVYTKPTGSGDAGAFYHSKITYTMTNNTQKIGIGEICYFFVKNEPTEKWFKNRIIRDDEIIIVGEALPTEEILFMSLGTDSSASPLGVRILVQELGFSMGEVKRKLYLIGYNANDEIPSKIDETNNKLDEMSGKLDTINSSITDKHLNEGTDSVSVNLISNFSLEDGGNLESIKNKTDSLTYHNYNSIDRLYTYDEIQNNKLDTINSSITDKHLNEATDSVSVNLISNYALESGGNLENINGGIGNIYGEMMTSNTNTNKLNNLVFGGGNQSLPSTSTLQNNLVYGFHQGHGGGTDDLHPLSVNENGHLSVNITSIEATENINCNITNASLAVTTASKTYSAPLTIFDTAGNQSSYLSNSVDYDGDIVSLDGYDKFLILFRLSAVLSNPGTFQILVSYDNITYYGLQTTSYDTAGGNLVAYPYYRLNGLFDNTQIVIGKGWGSGYNSGNTTPFDNFGYKYLKIRMNISGTGSSISSPYFEIVRLN